MVDSWILLENSVGESLNKVRTADKAIAFLLLTRPYRAHREKDNKARTSTATLSVGYRSRDDPDQLLSVCFLCSFAARMTGDLSSHLKPYEVIHSCLALLPSSHKVGDFKLYVESVQVLPMHFLQVLWLPFKTFFRLIGLSTLPFALSVSPWFLAMCFWFMFGSYFWVVFCSMMDCKPVRGGAHSKLSNLWRWPQPYLQELQGHAGKDDGIKSNNVQLLCAVYLGCNFRN